MIKEEKMEYSLNDAEYVSKNIYLGFVSMHVPLIEHLIFLMDVQMDTELCTIKILLYLYK